MPTFGSDVEFWAVIGHAEVEQANRDWETFSAYDGTTIVPFPPKRRGVMLVAKDPPEHLKLRKLISAGFTPRMIGRLEEQIVGRTERILDDAEARGEVDFVPDIAYQLPMHVIADIVGIPEPDRPEVFRLTEIIMQAADPELGITPAARRDAEAGLFGYAHQLSVDKRANPTDDVWSILASGELDQFELDMFFMALTLAGSETTRNALTQGLMALLDNPDQLDDLRKDPSLTPTAAEEMLRWASPAICFARTVTRDTELGGQHLRSGDRVGLFYPSANRDERAFANASRFDIRRSPNPHVAFGGGGPHFCMGASLARCEVNVIDSGAAAPFRHDRDHRRGDLDERRPRRDGRRRRSVATRAVRANLECIAQNSGFAAPRVAAPGHLCRHPDPAGEEVDFRRIGAGWLPRPVAFSDSMSRGDARP